MTIKIPKEWKSIKRKHRYTDPYKDRLWSALSLFVVARDTKLYKTCISCHKVKQLTAGHYAPASNCGLELAFDEKNVNGECAGCNCFDSGHLIGYRNGLVARYGPQYASEIDKRYNDARYKGKTSKISTLEYIKRALYFVERAKEFSPEKSDISF